MAHIAVLDYHQRESDKPLRFVKRSAGQMLVNRALAYWVIRNAVLRMMPTHEIRVIAISYTPPGPSQSQHSGTVKWEPPAHKRNLKAHPFIPMQTDEMEAISLSRKERSEQFYCD